MEGLKQVSNLPPRAKAGGGPDNRRFWKQAARVLEKNPNTWFRVEHQYLHPTVAANTIKKSAALEHLKIETAVRNHKVHIICRGEK